MEKTLQLKYVFYNVEDHIHFRPWKVKVGKFARKQIHGFNFKFSAFLVAKYRAIYNHD